MPGGSRSSCRRELIRRDFFFPIFVTVVTCFAAIIVLELSWLALFPILFAGLLAIAYSGTLHYLALELAMRPILFDINAALETPVRIDRPSLSAPRRSCSARCR